MRNAGIVALSGMLCQLAVADCQTGDDYLHFQVGAVVVGDGYSSYTLATGNASDNCEMYFAPGNTSGGRFHIQGRTPYLATVSSYFHEAVLNEHGCSDWGPNTGAACSPHSITNWVEGKKVFTNWKLPAWHHAADCYAESWECFLYHDHFNTSEASGNGDLLRVIVNYRNDGNYPTAGNPILIPIKAEIPYTTKLDGSGNGGWGGFAIRLYDKANPNKEFFIIKNTTFIDEWWNGLLYDYSSPSPTPPTGQTGTYCSPAGLGWEATVCVVDKYAEYSNSVTLTDFSKTMVFTLPINYPVLFDSSIGAERHDAYLVVGPSEAFGYGSGGTIINATGSEQISQFPNVPFESRWLSATVEPGQELAVFMSTMIAPSTEYVGFALKPRGSESSILEAVNQFEVYDTYYNSTTEVKTVDILLNSEGGHPDVWVDVY